MNTSARKTWLRRGLGRTEVIVIVSVVAAVAVVGCLGSTFLAGLLLPALGKARQNALSLKDKAQLRETHQAMALLNSGLGGDGVHRAGGLRPAGVGPVGCATQRS